MCEFASAAIVGAALTAASTAATYVAEEQKTDNINDQQKKTYEETSRAAQENYRRQIDMTNKRLQQEQAAASQESQAESVEIAQAQGQARAVVGERGAVGNSVNILFADFARLDAVNNRNSERNSEWLRDQSREELLSLQAGSNARILGASPRFASGPSALGLGIDLAGSGLKYTDKYMADSDKGWHKQK